MSDRREPTMVGPAFQTRPAGRVQFSLIRESGALETRPYQR